MINFKQINNLISRLSFKHISFIFWGTLIVLSLIKVYFITPNDLSNDNFIYTYKFLTPDSYDWIINGKFLFVDQDISYRQPGLPLIIKLLLNFDLLGLLPLINHIILIVLLYFIYRITLSIREDGKSKYLALFLIFMLYCNYYLQYFTNLILADLYAITFITISFFLLFTNRIKLSFLFLGISWLFQNFAPVLVPALVIYIFYTNKEKINLLTWFKKLAIYAFLFLLPSSWWLIYKTILFGNPLYTKVIQFELLKPSMDSLDYYGFNALAIFGFGIILIYFFLVIKLEYVWYNKKLLALVTSILISFVFWIVLYDWNDRRFLLYFIPYYIPLFYLMLMALNWRTIYKTVIAFVLLLNTTLAVPPRNFEDYLPIFPGILIERQQNNKLQLTVNKSNIRLLKPFLYENYRDRNILRNDKNTLANMYRRIIIQNYHPDTNTMCLDSSKFYYSYYQFKNIFKYINNGKNLLSTVIDDKCYTNPEQN